MRGLIAGALFGAEIYVPYLLIDDYGFSPTWAGLGLTAAALAWAVAADIQGRFGDRIGNARITLSGTALLVGGDVVAALTAALAPVARGRHRRLGARGRGMGLMYPRLTVLTLAYSTPQNQGFNSSALSISDSVGSATAIAAMGLVFTALAGTDAGVPGRVRDRRGAGAARARARAPPRSRARGACRGRRRRVSSRLCRAASSP